jgi:alcohol dehydrogenase class IV
MNRLLELLNDSVWHFAVSRVKFGIGAADEVGYDIKSLGVKKVLLVTDESIMKSGVVDIVTSSLDEQKIEYHIWDRAEPEPSLKSVLECIGYAKKIEPEGFISIGGGSVMDTAKIVDLIITHGGDVLDYIAPPTGKGKPPEGPLKPHIAIPTTSGTGSETSPAAVVNLVEQKLKAGISHHFLRPTLAILDPRMTVTCPPRITASAGMDALSHAIGSYTTRRFDQKPKPKTPLERPAYAGRTPLTDIFSSEAIKIIASYLRRAVYHPKDLEARAGMQIGSFYAAVAFTNAGVLPDHAISYPIGGRYRTPHGLTVAVLLPAVMEFCLPSDYNRFADVARFLGEDVEGTSIFEAAHKSIEAVKRLEKDIGVPSGLEALGIKEEDIPVLAKETLKEQRLLACSPRPITEEDIKQILRSAMKNW